MHGRFPPYLARAIQRGAHLDHDGYTSGLLEALQGQGSTSATILELGSKCAMWVPAPTRIKARLEVEQFAIEKTQN